MVFCGKMVLNAGPVPIHNEATDLTGVVDNIFAQFSIRFVHVSFRRHLVNIVNVRENAWIVGRFKGTNFALKSTTIEPFTHESRLESVIDWKKAI